MYLGIDVGGTKVLFAVFDEYGRIIFEHKAATPKKYNDFLELVGKTYKTKLSKFKPVAACCALPGIIDREENIVLYYGNLPWKNTPAKKDIGEELGIPLSIENDAKLAGLSEAQLHKKYKSVLYLTLGTGIGISVIVNGVIDLNAGDAGGKGIILEHKGKLKDWEEFASGRYLVKQYGKKASELEDAEAWKDYAANVACGLEQFLATFRPEVVIVGGGVGAHFEKFEKYLAYELEKYESKMLKVPRLLKAKRAEEAVIYGCYEYIKEN